MSVDICAMHLNSCAVKSCFFWGGFVFVRLLPLGPLFFFGGGGFVLIGLLPLGPFFFFLQGSLTGCEGLRDDGKTR